LQQLLLDFDFANHSEISMRDFLVRRGSAATEV
jgi:hypothetical protein